MYRVIYQDQGSLEIVIDGVLTRDDFKEVIHQLESLCTTFKKINVLFDLGRLERYGTKIVIEEYGFYRDHKEALGRVAIVSDSRLADAFTRIFARFVDMQLKLFPTDRIEEARRWIFPTKLP